MVFKKKQNILTKLDKEKYTVYILRTSFNTLYTGQTNNLQRRLKEHENKNGKSAKYLKYFASFKLVYTETFSTRKEAMQREHKLKKFAKIQKEELIASSKPCYKKILKYNIPNLLNFERA